MRLIALSLFCLATILSNPADAVTRSLTQNAEERFAFDTTDDTQFDLGEVERIERTYTFDAFDSSLGDLVSVRIESRVEVVHNASLEGVVFFNPALPTPMVFGIAEFGASISAVLDGPDRQLVATDGLQSMRCDNIIGSPNPLCPLTSPGFFLQDRRSGTLIASDWVVFHGLGDVIIDLVLETSAELLNGRSVVNSGTALGQFSLTYTYVAVQASPPPVPLPAGLPLYLGLTACLGLISLSRRRRS